MSTNASRPGGGWNDKVIDEFRANQGNVGGPFAGAPMILIHHRGARSGLERVNPLVYLPDGGEMVIAATKGGAPTNPDWYHNLKAHPRITAEVGTETFTVDATEITGSERDELWRRMVELRPGFADYETKTSRVFPVFRLTRVDAGA
ncbi:nitroreductase family deazaflavin-dependent oxidoreductase [Microlunatus ginsengisoli]|uniref:Nitroreductase family deazaflavin-dependent oxidoreductase n=1 Tax=Microlunatus ginsengisoli TaxID=363863 RepID=A0ABP7AD07_9ACTN